MVNFINLYGSALLRILNLILWSYWFSQNKFKGFNKETILFFLGFNFIHVIWSTAMIIGNIHPKIFITFWIIIVIFEIVMILSVLYRVKNLHEKYHDYYILTIAILSLPVILAGIVSSIKMDYKPINVTDFNIQTLIALGAVWILKEILNQDDFIQNIEAFFIFAGFIMLFSLDTLASNSLFFGFLKNWRFRQMSTLMSQIFWIGGVFSSWKIRSKYL